VHDARSTRATRHAPARRDVLASANGATTARARVVGANQQRLSAPAKDARRAAPQADIASTRARFAAASKRAFCRAQHFVAADIRLLPLFFGAGLRVCAMFAKITRRARRRIFLSRAMMSAILFFLRRYCCSDVLLMFDRRCSRCFLNVRTRCFLPEHVFLLPTCATTIIAAADDTFIAALRLFLLLTAEVARPSSDGVCALMLVRHARARRIICRMAECSAKVDYAAMRRSAAWRSA